MPGRWNGAGYPRPATTSCGGWIGFSDQYRRIPGASFVSPATVEAPRSWVASLWVRWEMPVSAGCHVYRMAVCYGTCVHDPFRSATPALSHHRSDCAVLPGAPFGGRSPQHACPVQVSVSNRLLRSYSNVFTGECRRLRLFRAGCLPPAHFAWQLLPFSVPNWPNHWTAYCAGEESAYPGCYSMALTPGASGALRGRWSVE